MLGWMLTHADEPLDQLVSYDQPACTVKQLLADLSRQTGITLFAPSPLDTEIVLVSVQKMPLKTLMEHLATVADGKWFKQPNGSYHLVRPPKLARERREQDNAQILAGLQRALRRKEPESMVEPLTEARVRQICEQIKTLMQEIERQNITREFEGQNILDWEHPLIDSLAEQAEPLDVGQRLIIRLVRQLDLRRLLAIPVGERRVFSNERGRYLEPFGFEVGSLLAQYQREAQWVYQVWTHPIDGIDAQRVEQFRYIVGDHTRRQEPPQAPLTRLYLGVGRSSPTEFSFDAVLVSEDLRQGVQGSSWWLGLEEEEDSNKAPSQSDSKPSQSETVQKPAVQVEWSELSRQFIEAYRAIERTAEPVAFPDVLDPAKVEPLSLVPSDVLRTYARQKGKPIIALIPDSLAWWLGNAVSEPNTLQGYLEFLHWDTDLQEREDVILLKPRWSPYQWGQRVDRLALSRWMQQLRQRGYPKLEDYLAVLQMYEQSGFANMVIPVYQSLTLPADDILEWIQGRHFSNRLSAKQLAYLQEGGQLTMKELSPVQREQLLRDIYFGYAELARVSPADGRPPAPVEGEEQEIAEVSLPHVFYSDGLPANLIIRLAREPSEVRDAFDVFNMGVFTTRRAGVWSGFRSIMNIAHDIHYAENPSLGGPLTYMQERANYYKTASLMPARRKPFRLEVRLGQRHAIYLTSRYYGMDLADYELLNEGKPATLDTLPDELKAKLERYLKLLKRE